MAVYILSHGRSGQVSYQAVLDFVKNEKNTIVVAEAPSSKLIRVNADDEAIQNIRNFAKGWHIETPIAHFHPKPQF